MRTTGSHPGGILIKPNDIPFEYVTPLVYVSDDGKKKELSSFTEYHFLENQLIKLDMLGHSDPTMLKELKDFTGFDFKEIRFNNPVLYNGILNKEVIGLKEKEDLYPFPSNTMGISEMNSDFTMKTLSELKPKNMFDLIAFSGYSHKNTVPFSRNTN